MPYTTSDRWQRIIHTLVMDDLEFVREYLAVPADQFGKFQGKAPACPLL
jgi:hypothetical protein